MRLAAPYEVRRTAALDPERRAMLGGRTAGAVFVASDGSRRPMVVARPGLARSLAGGAVCDTPRSTGRGSSDALAGLILDGVVEVEMDGGFVSGSTAAAVLLPEVVTSDRGTDVSRDALAHGAELTSLDHRELTARLYFYGRVPLAPTWCRRLPDDAAVKRFLGLGGRAGLQALLGRDWEGGGVSDAHPWRMWRLRAARSSTRAGSSLKLYITVAPAALPDALRAVVSVAMEHDTTGFKVGRDAATLLRPDKLVCYVDSRRSLRRVACMLAPALAAMPVQALPFAPVVDGTAALAWGVDPSSRNLPLPWGERGSWRLYLAAKLAGALLIAQAEGLAPGDAITFACRRIVLDGVDPATWAPLGIRNVA